MRTSSCTALLTTLLTTLGATLLTALRATLLTALRATLLTALRTTVRSRPRHCTELIDLGTVHLLGTPWTLVHDELATLRVKASAAVDDSSIRVLSRNPEARLRLTVTVRIAHRGLATTVVRPDVEGAAIRHWCIEAARTVRQVHSSLTARGRRHFNLALLVGLERRLAVGPRAGLCSNRHTRGTVRVDRHREICVVSGFVSRS